MTAASPHGMVPFRPRPYKIGHWCGPFLWVFLASFFVRLTVALVAFGALDADPDAYRRIAQSYHSTGILGLQQPDGSAVPTAYRPPLYPWLLSWFQGLGSDRYAIAFLHALLGSLTVALTFDIAKRLRLSQGMGLVAALLVMIDPILLRQSTLVMTETLATMLGVALWWLCLVIGWSGARMLGRGALVGVGLGICLGIACLCRPTALAWCVCWAALELRHQPVRACCIVLGCMAILLPWWMRNQSEFGKGVWTTTHGGYTLLLANNPILYDHWAQSSSRTWEEDRFHDWWASKRQERFQGEPASEIALDSFANALGWESIQSRPWMFIKACAIRQCWLWAWWPSERQAGLGTRLVIGIWYAMASILGLWGLVKLLGGTRQELVLWLPALALAASLCMVHAVYWSNMRMRAPAIPLVSLLVAHGCSRGWFWSVRSSRSQ